MYPDPRFWADRRVLVTGHTGFKGGWLALWLSQMKARVTGISLPPITEPNLFSLARVDEVTNSHLCDIRDATGVSALVGEADPEIVFHLAAQPLVRTSYRDPLDTIATNVQGTANLLDALRSLKTLRVVVVITTDKVYKGLEPPVPYREDDTLGGHDPYSTSKAAAELIVACYRSSYLHERGVAVATARAGNVIGGGDWSEDRLIPDAVRAWAQGATLVVRRPDAVRPWQHVLEPLTGYLGLAERLWHEPDLAGAYNFGPHTLEASTVREVITLARSAYGTGEVSWGDGAEGPHEMGRLTLDSSKARLLLGLEQRWDLETSVTRTMQWYRRQADGRPARLLCEADIAAFGAAG
jgi:CDP-glucose 4,6-dehydratase